MVRWGRAAIIFESLFLGALTWADVGSGWRLRETISDQVYGPWSWLLLASFFIHAASLATLAVWRARVRVPLLIGAVGMLGAAFFWTDPPGIDSWVGTVHVISAVMAFGGVASAAWMERVHLAVVPLALLVVASTLVMAAAAQEGGLFLGIVERLQVYINGAWIINAALAPRGFSSKAGSRAT